MKRGRPKIYYDFTHDMNRHKRVRESIDTCLQNGLLTLSQHRLALKLRWLYTVQFGLPTVSAYNILKIKGRDIPKYDEQKLFELRDEYKRVTEYLLMQNKLAGRLFMSVVIHNKIPKINEYNDVQSMAKHLEFIFKNENLTHHNNYDSTQISTRRQEKS